MNAKNLTIASLAATLAFVASATIAMAQPGVITSDTKVRTHASNSASVIDWAYDGQSVNIKKCGSGWCLIKFSGQSGWVKQNKLAFYDNNNGHNNGHHNGHHNDPAVNLGIYGGPGGVSFGFGLSSY